jgi:hypothetical protein
MSFEHSVKVLVNYIRRQEDKWGHVNTPWGTLLILPEANLNPILREVERWIEIEDQGRATRLNVYTPLSPTMIATEKHVLPPEEHNPDTPVEQHTQHEVTPRPAPTFVSAATTLGGKGELKPGT